MSFTTEEQRNGAFFLSRTDAPLLRSSVVKTVSVVSPDSATS
jgi:hypothetical protein